MDIKNFLNTVCNEIKYKPIRKDIEEELELHIKDIKDDYIKSGMSEVEAEENAVKQMGEAQDIGKKLNKIHRPKLDWKLLILVGILMGFGLIVSILKQTFMDGNYIGKTIFYMLIGIGLSIAIYFFDYRKLKSYSNLIYLVASIIMILPMLGFGVVVCGLHYVKISVITFYPATVTIPLYIIAFVGFIVDYNKNNNTKISILDEEFSINKDFIKISVLTIFSLMLFMNISLINNAVMLFLAYLIIITVKIVQDKENRIKKLVMIYTPILSVIIFFTIAIFTSPYKSARIIGSFYPESDPTGAGYIGMLQKDVLKNAKFVGEAETQVISSDEYIISLESNYTFIYLLGKIGILFSGILILVILLTSLKLILNAKNITDQYGKLLIIGLSSLYIIQSVLNVLMNLNLGIKTNINLPFVSYGGVYFVINIISIAIIFSVYRRKDINLRDRDSQNKSLIRRLCEILLRIDKTINAK